MCALLCVCAFAAAGGFSSRVSTGIGSDVLLDGTNCGIVGLPDIDKADLLNAFRSKLVSSAENYAQQCYSSSQNSSSVGMFDCNRLVMSQLPMSVDDAAPCPFQNGLCRSNTSNLLLDSGYVDSHDQLGLNSPPQERILSRSVYHCAPLRTDGYTNDVAGEDRNYTRYYYGGAIRGSASNLTSVNYTFEAETLDSQYSTHMDNFQRNRGANFILP